MPPENENAESNQNRPADDEAMGTLHVLDLPQLYNQPSAQSLLSALSLLAITPFSWAAKPDDTRPASISEDGLPSYLTRIIASPLAWMSSEADREQVWETASKRLAERSGRTALPTGSRTFRIPTDGRDSSDTIDIELREPSLTGDNVGHKTWVASYLLARRLPTLLPRLFPGIKPATETKTNPPPPTHPRILELGAGTGLAGLAASALFSTTTTHLTDLTAILPNLQHNITANTPLTTAAGSTVTAGPLDWSSPHPRDSYALKPHFDLILAADSLYAPEHPLWIARTMAALLRTDDEGGRSARVVVELPLRSDRYPPPEHEALRARMREVGFVLGEEGEEVGFDDWEEPRPGGGQLEVRCWWSVWRWK